MMLDQENTPHANAIPLDDAIESVLLDEATQTFVNDVDEHVQKLKNAEAMYAATDALYIEIVKPILDDRRKAMADIFELAGVGHAFQDEEGIVYQLDAKKGQWIDFTPFEIKRTRRTGESKGTLSMKAAQEIGYEPLMSKPVQDEEAV